MAQEQQNINIAAPAFAGINTEDSPLQTGDSFAEIADNCVIDRYGRLGARRGFEEVTVDGSAYGGFDVEALAEHSASIPPNPSVIFSFANNKIFKGDLTPVDVTPGGHPGITGNDWDHGQVGGVSFWAQEGHEMLWYDESTDTVYSHNNAPGNPHAVMPEGNVCLGAWGRAWTYERNASTSNRGTLWISDLLIPYEFDSGSAGSIILDNVWPDGNDDVIGMAAHNNFLILFGRRQILVYGGVEDNPVSSAQLVDSVTGMGCIQRDSVANTGEDVLWLDSTGVRSFNRIIQEKSLPIGDVSANVRSDISQAIVDSQDIGNKFGFAIYSQATGIYAVTFPDLGYIYVFNLIRDKLDNGAYRTTRWTGLQKIKAAVFTNDSRTLVGADANIARYTGFADWGEPYRMRYYSNPLDYDAPSRVKIPKQVDFTMIGGLGMTFQVNWAFDFQTNYRRKNFKLAGQGVAEYNLSEFNSGAEYSGGTAITTAHVNVGGKGRYMTIALETNVTGPTSIQEISIQTLIGRIV